MVARVHVYLEIGSRRAIAGAIDWPGWCRGGRGEDAALQILSAYGPRYLAALGPLADGLEIPADPAVFEVVERLPGNATTDFGAPGAVPAADERPMDVGETERHVQILRSCWAAFDAAVAAAAGKPLVKGPRGGGRELEAIVSHVFEAQRSYFAALWGPFRSERGADPPGERERLRDAIQQAVRARARGEPRPGRRAGKGWTPRYFVRRSAWHVLDHAWEIEDRAGEAP
ncbi:MAG: hypothetical protein Kow0010_16210 [Dehalococcoidia bacterium]